MKQYRDKGFSPIYSYAVKVNNSLQNSEIFMTKMKDSHGANIVADRQNILMEYEDN